MSHTYYEGFCNDDMFCEHNSLFDNTELSIDSLVVFFTYFISINIICLTITLFMNYIYNYVCSYRLAKKYQRIYNRNKLLINQINNLLQDNQSQNQIIKNTFERYVELIELRQFLENKENKSNILKIYDEPYKYIDKTIKLINDKYRYVFLDKTKFLNYYRGYFVENDLTLVNNDELVYINIHNLYHDEQLLIGKNMFDIENTDTYYPLDNNISTSFAKLNVIRWLIEIGFYDIITIH